MVNCAGALSQQGGATASDFIAVNTIFPHRLQEACEAVGASLIHISTDIVCESGEEGG